MPDLDPKPVPAEKLLIDPNNYRFQDTDDYVPASEQRFHEETVQGRAYEKIRSEEGLQALKSSILRNGYIEVERIVVRPYAHTPDEKYVVIEGNRRLAAVKWILSDHTAGREIPSSVLTTLENLPVLVAETSGEDSVFRASLMGIRHVSGIRDWGGYQRAKLVVNMRDDLGLEASEVAERLGMSTHEVNRRYRAFKALEQMKNDEEFSEFAQPSMYPIFHEAVSLPTVRDEWLRWSENESLFTDQDELRKLYELLTPTEDEEGNNRDPKITSYSQIRQLRTILHQPEAKRSLFDPHRSFQDAVTVTEQEKLSKLWASEVAAAIKALQNMGIQELKNLGEEDIENITKLQEVVQERLRDHERLVGRQTSTD